MGNRIECCLCQVQLFTYVQYSVEFVEKITPEVSQRSEFVGGEEHVWGSASLDWWEELTIPFRKLHCNVPDLQTSSALSSELIEMTGWEGCLYGRDKKWKTFVGLLHPLIVESNIELLYLCDLCDRVVFRLLTKVPVLLNPLQHQLHVVHIQLQMSLVSFPPHDRSSFVLLVSRFLCYSVSISCSILPKQAAVSQWRSSEI